MSRSFLVGLSGLVACSLLAGSASAEDNYDFKKEGGIEHGSQVSSSEWLPIIVGGTLGLTGGGLLGYSFDDHQPAVAGPLLGGLFGGMAGAAGGAWIIRSFRDKDARTPAMLTGLALGASAGVIMFSKMEPEGRALETVGKYGVLAFAPVLGAVAGYQLASFFQSKPPKEKEVIPVAFVPTVAPVVGPHGSTGMTFGLDGAF